MSIDIDESVVLVETTSFLRNSHVWVAFNWKTAAHVHSVYHDRGGKILWDRKPIKTLTWGVESFHVRKVNHCYVEVQLWGLYAAQTLLLVYILTLRGLSLMFPQPHHCNSALLCTQTHACMQHTRWCNYSTSLAEWKRAHGGRRRWIIWEQSRHLCGFPPLTLWLTGTSRVTPRVKGEHRKEETEVEEAGGLGQAGAEAQMELLFVSWCPRSLDLWL